MRYFPSKAHFFILYLSHIVYLVQIVNDVIITLLHRLINMKSYYSAKEKHIPFKSLVHNYTPVYSMSQVYNLFEKTFTVRFPILLDYEIIYRAYSYSPLEDNKTLCT